MTDPNQDDMGRSPRTSGEEPADRPDEMRMVSQRDRTYDDAVLRGDVDGVPSDLAPLAAFIAALRGRAAQEAAPPMGASLRAQVVAPNIVALAAARSARRMLAIAAAVLAVVALVGIGAAQNRLPGELQDAVASTAEVLGIDVPHSSERGEARSDEGFEHGRDDTAPNAPSPDGEPGYGGTTPGGATPAVPGSPEGPATPADPAGSEQPVKAAEKAPAPRAPETPDSPPGQGGAVPPANPQGSDNVGGPSSAAAGDRGPAGSDEADDTSATGKSADEHSRSE